MTAIPLNAIAYKTAKLTMATFFFQEEEDD
jgi:hypothetical protein